MQQAYLNRVFPLVYAISLSASFFFPNLFLIVFLFCQVEVAGFICNICFSIIFSLFFFFLFFFCFFFFFFSILFFYSPFCFFSPSLLSFFFCISFYIIPFSQLLPLFPPYLGKILISAVMSVSESATARPRR